MAASEPPGRSVPSTSLVSSTPFDLGRLLDELHPVEPDELRIEVRRPDDLLVFDLLFDNLRIAQPVPPGPEDGGAPARLVRKDQGAPATLIVELPPQSFGEEAFLEVVPAVDDHLGEDGIGGEKEEWKEDAGLPKKHAPTKSNEEVPPLPSARVRMAGRSRLAFAMPSDVESLAFTLAAVLEAMRTWPLRLDVCARPDPPPPRPGFLGTYTVGDALAGASVASSWAATRHELVAGLETRSEKGLGVAILEAAERVAERAIAGLGGAGGECLAPVLQEHLFDQMDALAERHRSLREGTSREAGLAALALASAESLAANASRLGVGENVLEVLPLLPLLLVTHVPPRTVTALELPYRLLLSPIEDARFTHRDLPVERHGRTELWHTRMTTGEDEFGPDAPGKARALWSPDYPIDDFVPLLSPEPNPFRMSLDPLDRKMLVKLMAGFNEKRPGGRAYRPLASRVDRLHLSSLGALFDAEGDWAVRPQGVDIEQWRHRLSLGRDAYVRVVYAGYLCPCGHACSLVKVTERKFERLGSIPGRVAVLRQRFFLVPRERVRTYDGAEHEFGGRNFPFTRVELLTRRTPDLIVPGEGASALAHVPSAGVIYEGEIVPRMAFWPMLPDASDPDGAVDFEFALRATDIAGRQVSFSMPLLFVGETANDQKDAEIRAAYDDAGTVGRRRADLGGATITYAPLDPGAEGDPRLPTERLTLAAGRLPGVHHPLAPNFHPEVEEARVGIRPLQKLLGKPDAVVDTAYPTVYKAHGFGETDPSQNRGQLFLRLVGSPFGLEFGGDPGQAKSDSLGSLAAPQMAIQGLSRITGPVAATPPSDPTDAAQVESALGGITDGTFDPTDFFDDARILGGVDLGDILDVVATLVGADVPKMVSRDLPDRVEARFTWDTEIKKSDPLGLFIPRADPGKPQTRLVMEGLTTTPIAAPQDATFRADAEIDNFKVNLFGFVIIWFELLAFRAEKGRKPDVTVQLRDGQDAVQFGGPLEFVNQLRDLIPAGGFSDPPAIEVTPSGIAASYFLNLPTVGVGIFTLSNVSLGAGFQLPFDATPASVRFAFSRRESPFSLTVSFLGGGGFFAIGVSTRGVTEIEAALEFGAGAAIDLGVASGSVEIKAGVYFHWLEPVPDQGSIELAGYVRLHGELSILGLISASLTFDLKLAYLKEGGESIVWGEATLVIEVEVLFFSADVSVRCRREFAGSESDPKFIDQIPAQAAWTEYCEAFAVEEAA